MVKQTMVLGTVLVSCLTAAALATPGGNILSGTVLARSRFVEPVNLRIKVGSGPGEVIHVSRAAQTVIQKVVIGPQGFTGWHSHPGPAVALIEQGSVVLFSADDSACSPRVYHAGQAFIDSGQGHVHFASNPSSTTNAELWVTYFDVPKGQPFRIDAPDPGNCNF